MKELSAISEACLAIAEEAGALVLAGHRSRPRTEEKEVHDLVTEFDRRSEDLIIERLSSTFPGVPVIAEERAGASVEMPEGLAFVVDPLDGTTNFVHGHPFWCVAIGLLDGTAPIAGAIVAPCLALRWRGGNEKSGAGGFAFRNEEACRVSTTSSFGASMIATGFPPNRDHAPENNFDSFMQVKRAARAVRRCGAAAVDIAFVADGTYDGYWERRLLLWDSVAAASMVLGAGGRITAIGGGPPRYEKGHIVATNGRIHDALLEAVG